MASFHWGGNWGYAVPADQRRCAHALIDRAGVDIVPGHSAHQPKAIEVHHDPLVLYGCGHLLNDYEAIGGHGPWRPELALMYAPELEPGTGDLHALALPPLRLRRSRREHPDGEAVAWLLERIDHKSARFGAGLTQEAHGTFRLQWGMNPGAR